MLGPASLRLHRHLTSRISALHHRRSPHPSLHLSCSASTRSSGGGGTGATTARGGRGPTTRSRASASSTGSSASSSDSDAGGSGMAELPGAKKRKAQGSLPPGLGGEAGEDAAASAAAAGEGVHHEVGPTYKVPGLLVTDHFFKVPLDHSGAREGQLSLFCRELVAPANARRQQPYLLYLQGGPGFESPRPTEASGWIKAALAHFRVVLLDQRGTGRSSPITTNLLARLGSPQAQADYLAHFRADSIVADAELVRRALVPASSTDGRWSVLGQSFGGFCAFTYLSMAPHGLNEVMTTGGIPPALSEPCPAERTYAALFARVVTQNRRYYARFPQDVAAVQRIVRHLDALPGGGAELPCGSRLTPRLLQGLGLSGLGSGGGFERLHYLLESFWDVDDQINPAFIRGFDSWMSWGTNPLYALLHEPIYCQGAASGWAAQRVRQRQPFAVQFDAVEAARNGQPVLFTGEMVFPWLFDDYAPLRPFKAAADLLAARADWPALYRPAVLAGNAVPVACATYLDDMYVDYDLAQESIAGVPGVRQWVTNEFKHSAIRDDGGRLLERLLGMVRDAILLE